MRIVNREEFLALPAPVLYSKVRKDAYKAPALAIKTGNHDKKEWFYYPLDPVASLGENNVERRELLDKAIAGETVDLTVNFETDYIDGTYGGEDTTFAILELDELRQLHALIGRVIAAAE